MHNLNSVRRREHSLRKNRLGILHVAYMRYIMINIFGYVVNDIRITTNYIGTHIRGDDGGWGDFPKK